jgi:hypothetical protein
LKAKKQLSRQFSRKRKININRIIYMIFITLTLLILFSQPVLAGTTPPTTTAPAAPTTTMWDKANEIMKDVYTQILLISTIAAIVTSAVALLLMNFSKCGKTVDESRAWLKRIIITWVILNGLGFIMSYIAPFFTGGEWTP